MTRFREILLGVGGEPLARACLALLRWSKVRAGVALAYHGLSAVPADLERELSPSHEITLFERQMQHVARGYRVVRATELRAAVARRKRGERFPLAITFDDDLPSHRRNAAPILTRLGLTATFFVCGASLERPFSFWWERLNRAVALGIDLEAAIPALGEHLARADPVNGEPRSIFRIGDLIQALPLTQRNQIAAELADRAGDDPPDAGMRSADIRSVTATGCEVGFHTLHHQYLPLLDDAALARAMTDGREEVARLAGSPLTAISYPHGGADDRVAAAARTAGFTCGYSMAGVAVGPETDDLQIGRIVPSFDSAGHLAMRIVYAIAISAVTR